MGTELKRYVLAQRPLQLLRTDGTLFVYDLFFYPYFAPDGAIKKLCFLNLRYCPLGAILCEWISADWVIFYVVFFIYKKEACQSGV